MEVKKIFLDTNVWLRYFLRDQEKQFQDCKKVIESIEQGKCAAYVSNIVLLELQYVLTKVYGLAKSETLEMLDAVLSTRGIVLIEKKNTKDAIELWQDHNIKYPDCLIASQLPQDCHLISYDMEFKSLSDVSWMTPDQLVYSNTK